MRYFLTEEFTPIVEVECVAQNISSEAVIELAEHPGRDSGVKLWPGKSLAIRAETYARRIGTGYGTCVLATVPLPGTGEATDNDIAKLFTAGSVEFVPDLFVKMSKLKYYKQLQDELNRQIFVAQVPGKNLSTNDFTDAYKAQLDDIASIILNVVENAGYAKRSEITQAVKYRGTVVLYADLPQNAVIGDMYNVQEADEAHNVKAGDNVIWNGASWDVMAGESSQEWTEEDIRAIFEGMSSIGGGNTGGNTGGGDTDEWATDEDIDALFGGGMSSDGGNTEGSDTTSGGYATDSDIDALFGGGVSADSGNDSDYATDGDIDKLFT